jgi:hypothetical protein
LNKKASFMAYLQARTGYVIILIAVIIILITACGSPLKTIASLPTSSIEVGANQLIVANEVATVAFTSMTSTHNVSQAPSVTATPSPTHSSSPSPSITPTKPPTQSPTPSISPTYAILRGTVKEQSNCRYGPGAAYLYKYGLYSGNTLDIIGRNETGTWILVQAIGGNNPCWIKASLMDIRGEVASLAPGSLPLPQSPYYGPLTGVSSKRDADTVIISWDTLNLRDGDDSLQYPYLIEAWLCHGGQIIFEPIGSWQTIVSVKDESGCSEQSHARIYGVEKHGYTAWVTVPWVHP